MNKNKTYSKKGLSKFEILICEKLEAAYIAGANINLELLKTIKSEVNPTKQQLPELMEAWEYWSAMPKPLIRESLKEPVNIDYLLITPVQKNAEGWPSFSNRFNKETLSKIDPLSGLTYFIQLYEDGRLYFKYNEIIGSRFVAYVKF